MTARAMTRGAARKRIGGTSITSRASISSLTFIVPISAAMADPTHAARHMPQLKAAMSRTSVTMTAAPRYISWLNLASSSPTCRERIMPVNSDTTVSTGSDRIPAAYSWSNRLARPRRLKSTAGVYATVFAITTPTRPTGARTSTMPRMGRL